VVLSSLAIIRPKQDSVDSSYLKYVLKAPFFINEAIGRKTGVAIRRIILKNLKTITIPVPPLEVQKRIVEILDEAFEGIERSIELTKQNLINARELFESYLNNIFTNKGDDWVEKKLGDLYEFKNGINFDKNQKGEKGILTIDVLNMYSNTKFVSLKKLYRVDKKVNKEYVLNSDDILFVRSSVKKEGVGWATLFESNIKEPVTYCGFIIRARPLKFNITNPNFLLFFFRSKNTREKIISLSKKSTITNINQDLLSNFTIFYPNLSKQQFIVEKLDQLLIETQRLEENYKRKLELLEELKQSILERAFRGELTQ
jgi:type I restriction enzyme S subunit